MDKEEDFDFSEEDFENLMEYYIEVGAVVVNGIDENGNFIYKITDLAREVAPELWAMHHEMVDEALLELFEKDLIEVEYDEELNANLKISDEAKKIMQQKGYVELDDPTND
jgi:hypothetical protein